MGEIREMEEVKRKVDDLMLRASDADRRLKRIEELIEIVDEVEGRKVK